MVQQSTWVYILVLQSECKMMFPVHCCAHRVELAIKDTSTDVDFFKSLEGTLVELYKLYHKSPLNWSGLQQVGETLQVKVVKLTGNVHLRSCLMDGKALLCTHLR